MKGTVKELNNQIAFNERETRRLEIEVNLANEIISTLRRNIFKMKKDMEGKIAFSIENLILRKKERFTQSEIVAETYEKLEIGKEAIEKIVREVISGYLDDGIVGWEMKNDEEGFILKK